MGNMNHEIVDLSENNLDLEKDRSHFDTPKMHISLTRCKLLPMTSLPSSSTGVSSPQANCIYVDSVHKKYIARTESLTGVYESVVILGPTQFDEDAKKHTEKLYLVEDAANISLYHYDGTQWCSIPRERSAAIHELRGLDSEEGECRSPLVIERVISFYGGNVLKGKLGGLSGLIDLNQIGVLDRELGEMIESYSKEEVKEDVKKEIKKKILELTEKIDDLERKTVELRRNVIQKILADAPANRKRAREVLAANDEPLAKKRNMNSPRRCLDFSNLSPIIVEPDKMELVSPLDGSSDLTCVGAVGSPLQTIPSQPSLFKNGDTLCSAPASTCLGQAEYHCNFWKEANVPIEAAPQAISHDAVNGLIERVERGDTTAYRQYAALLETGSAGVTKDEKQAILLLQLAAEEDEQPRKQPFQSRDSSATDTIFGMFQGPNPFELPLAGDDKEGQKDGVSLEF